MNLSKYLFAGLVTLVIAVSVAEIIASALTFESFYQVSPGLPLLQERIENSNYISAVATTGYVIYSYSPSHPNYYNFIMQPPVASYIDKVGYWEGLTYWYARSPMTFSWLAPNEVSVYVKWNYRDMSSSDIQNIDYHGWLIDAEAPSKSASFSLSVSGGTNYVQGGITVTFYDVTETNTATDKKIENGWLRISTARVDYRSWARWKWGNEWKMTAAIVPLVKNSYLYDNRAYRIQYMICHDISYWTDMTLLGITIRHVKIQYTLGDNIANGDGVITVARGVWGSSQ
ncbi:MAG: hypothetical protein QW348_05030 [Ignisphaera sp.]